MRVDAGAAAVAALEGGVLAGAPGAGVTVLARVAIADGALAVVVVAKLGVWAEAAAGGAPGLGVGGRRAGAEAGEHRWTGLTKGECPAVAVYVKGIGCVAGAVAIACAYVQGVQGVQQDGWRVVVGGAGDEVGEFVDVWEKELVVWSGKGDSCLSQTMKSGEVGAKGDGLGQ